MKLIEKLIRQTPRPRIAFHAPWAILKKPYTGDKRRLDGNKIVYDVKREEEFADHIEMSGFLASSIISYGNKKNGKLRLMRHVVFPNYRTYPNKTHNSLDHNFKGIRIAADGDDSEKALKYAFDGALHIFTKIGVVEAERILFTACDKPALIEIVKLRNASDAPVEIVIKDRDGLTETPAFYGHNRQKYYFSVYLSLKKSVLKVGEELIIVASYNASTSAEQIAADGMKELSERYNTIDKIDNALSVETPDIYVNAMIRYAKLRACESIYKLKNGLMHSPGGGAFYAAVWNNDQCEYVNPLFAYLGYDVGFRQAVDCFDYYKPYMNSDSPLVSSIISGGDGYWNGAGDRGDNSMYAYGLTRFLLSTGDKNLAEKYADTLIKCFEFINSKFNSSDIIESDADELENRFLSGNANLSTSCLAYDAFISASYLFDELGMKELSREYKESSERLLKGITAYFSADVENVSTYRYCKEDTRLRSWICLPMTVGIDYRTDNTVDALLSDKLNTGEGLLTRSGEKTFWDRSTLYALRGMIYAGKQNRCMKLLLNYTHARLLGEHIPYAVEAFPEGNQAQLSAESGLYVRIFTEGVLGYRPLSFTSYEIKPNLPDSWNRIAFKNFCAHGRTVDIVVNKKANEYVIELSDGTIYRVDNGDKIIIEY